MAFRFNPFTANFDLVSEEDLSGYLKIDGTRAMTGPLKLDLDSTATQAGELRYNSTTNQAEYYNGGGWIPMGITRQVTGTDTSVAEGDNSVTLSPSVSTFKIIYLQVTTTSTDWDMILYTKDDYTTGELQVVDSRDGNYMVKLDLPWSDADSTGELHYNFTSNSGSETHDIKIYGEEQI